MIRSVELELIEWDDIIALLDRSAICRNSVFALLAREIEEQLDAHDQREREA